MKRKIVSILVVLVLVSSISAIPALAVEEDDIEASIMAGLTWLTGQQNATNGSWANSVGHTGLAVLKLEDRAYELGLDPFQTDSGEPDYYEYSQNVIDGLNYIFSQAYIWGDDAWESYGLQNGEDPDTDHDGIAVYFGGTYNTSIAMMAIAGSEAPSRTVSGGACNDWTYQEVLQETTDFMVFSQVDSGSDTGGWGYSYCDNGDCGTDNSNGGYAALGLGYAQVDPFNCTVPGWAYTRLSSYCDYIQNDVNDPIQPDDGGSGYTGPNDGWVNVLKTGNLIYQMALTGDTDETTRVQDAVDYLERHWGDNADPGWRPNHYQAMYTIMKGLEAMGIFTFGDPEIDWYEDFSTAIVDQQNDNGSWPGCPCYCWGDGACHGCDQIICTTWALLTLERAVAPLIRPVVSDILGQCVCEGDSFSTISLDGYVEDGDNADEEIVWTTSGDVDLTVSIDSNRVATITYPEGWTGSETITFTATDPDDQSDSDDATFNVCPVPVVGDIPDQTAPFEPFDLDDYCSSASWSASTPPEGWSVVIDGGNVVTVSAPEGAGDPVTITFTARYTCCDDQVVCEGSDDATFTPLIEVAVDIKPTSCPNPLNVKSKGVLPVAILGTEDFDVTQIDPATVTLEGVEPLRSELEDVATPYEPFVGKEDCMDCNELKGDGYVDLTLKFDKQTIVEALGEVEDGACVVLMLEGYLYEEFGGTLIAGEDVVRIIKKQKGG